MANKKKKSTNRSVQFAAKRSTTKRPRKKTASPARPLRQTVRGRSRSRMTTFAAVAADPAADNLRKIDNIVVLVMENRSFDHMLGYLKLEEQRNDVEGLTPGLSNSDGQKSY